MSFEKAHSEIKILVENFKANENFYISKEYQEAEVRKDFIDKLFIALGWDVLHHSQTNPYEQEVKVEKGVNVSGAQKKADYSFSLAPNYRDPKFFTEAKKPSKDLYNSDYYFQTVRYGWHKTTPLAVLTDFEEFHILDCRFSPDISTILHRKIKQYHYSEYIDSDKFAEIYWLFSREAVINNSLEKFAENLPKPKGKAYQKALFAYEKHLTIDDAFLEEIDGIREILAKAFKKNDETLDSEELTEATQRTIDRLVFIRFLEDKLIEQVHYVNTFGENGKAWDGFIALCIKLDAKYNGIVFKKCFIDDNSFKGPVDSEFHDICQNICHLNSRFLYNEIPIHILGSIYERFLGKVVHATNKRVTVEEKPEVRKAGGVFYTPKNIVDYIVKNTVGKQIEGKDPEQISKLRFADIACGSGSFLIGVLEYLLDYYNKYYQQHPEKAKKDKCLFKDGIWILSIKQKQNILRNNIYGVDIDNQAVEVTQLSLSLKMLEDETTATANEMQVLFHEKILPDMSNNIICGNSLIGTDILTQTLFASDEERKLNPMNFEDVFKDLMKNGGFDAVVGNPPYVKARDYNSDKDIYRKYLNKSSKYETLHLMWDLYIPFLEKGVKLLKEKGILGFIVPDTLEKAQYSELIRKFIVDNYFIPQIDFFPESYIFKSNNKIVGVKNIILFVSKSKGEKTKKIIHSMDYQKIKIETVSEYNESIFSSNTISVDLTKRPYVLLGDLCYVSYGLRLNSDEKKARGEFKKRDLLSDEKTNNCYRKYTEGKYISRYAIDTIKWVEWGTNRCPSQLVRPTFPELYEPEKILLGNINRVGSYDDSQIICDNTLIVAVLFKDLKGINNSNIRKYLNNVKTDRKKMENESKNFSLKYILSLINSKVNQFYMKFTLRKGELHAYPDDWKKIVIPIINFQNKTEKSAHDKIVSLVEQMLEAKKEIKTSKTEKDKTYYERKCSSLDSALDAEVYKLYGLTEDEIRIVENS